MDGEGKEGKGEKEGQDERIEGREGGREEAKGREGGRCGQ